MSNIIRRYDSEGHFHTLKPKDRLLIRFGNVKEDVYFTHWCTIMSRTMGSSLVFLGPDQLPFEQHALMTAGKSHAEWLRGELRLGRAALKRRAEVLEIHMNMEQYRTDSIALGTAETVSPVFSGTVTNVKCPYCGNIHDNVACSLVKAFEYHANGTLKRVEFKTASDYPQAPTLRPFNGGQQSSSTEPKSQWS